MPDVSVKMNVSGVAQFKQGMKQSEAAVKTLDQALKLNEQQFKANGDAEEHLQTKTKLLQQQIKEQTNVVQQAKSALEAMKNSGDQSSVAFQKMQAEVYKAETSLSQMQVELDNVGESGEDAQSGVSDMNSALRRIGEGVSAQNVISALDSIKSKLESAIKTAWRMGESLVNATLGAGSWADELVTTSTQYEITPEQLQRMRKTANLIDTDVDTILTAQQKLTQGLGKNSKEALGAFATFVKEGLLPENYDPRGKNPVDAFWDAGEALMQLGDAYDKQVYAQALFGKGWKELIPLFQTGREEYDRTMASWSVVSDDTIKRLGEMDDQYQKLQGEFETFKMELLGTFAGPLKDGMEVITGLFQELNTYLQTPEGKALLESMGQAVSGLFKDLQNIDPEQVVEGFTGVFNQITEGFKFVYENKDAIIGALEGIAIGWGAVTIGGSILKILELVNGLKWLSGGPKIQLPNLFGGNGGTGTTGTGTGTGGGGGGAFNFIATTAAALLAYPTVKRAMEEGFDFLNPFADMYKNHTPDILDIINPGTGDIYNRLINQNTNSSMMPGKSPYEENLQRYYYDVDPTTGEILSEKEVAEKMDRMATVAEETAVVQQTGSRDVTSAITDLGSSLPAALSAAVQAGMANVTILISEGAVGAIGDRLGGKLWNNTMTMIH